MSDQTIREKHVQVLQHMISSYGYHSLSTQQIQALEAGAAALRQPSEQENEKNDHGQL